jgi:CheY-like chemotaxis protein
VRLTSQLDPAASTVHGDSGRLQQVVWNLLTNAIKFTPKGGQVQVTLQRIGPRLELSISDSGIGIPASYLPHVFDRFSQQDSSTTRAFGGLGLGLAICRQLVELHGGTIRASSAGEGQGASFVVELPVSQAPQQTEAAQSGPPAGAGAADLPPLPRLGGVHVFIVDDEPDARELLRRMFEDQGAQVTGFASAGEALAAVQRTRPALIVSDIGMPAMDGYQFMRALRVAEGRDERIPAVALTAFARAEDRKKSLLAGYQAHLAKPFDMAELILTAAGLLGR